MIGNRLGQRPAHYFVALTINPKSDVGSFEKGVQTVSELEGDSAEFDIPGNPGVELGPKPPLVYAEIVSTKGEAAGAVMRLIARCRDDHGSSPGHLIFRLHSDKGQ